MTTLLIKDLPAAAELDRAAMSSITGGCYTGMPAYCLPSYCTPGYGKPAVYGAPKSEFAFDASQMIGQTQNVVNNNGNNVAFSHGISSTVNPTQTANNNISF